MKIFKKNMEQSQLTSENQKDRYLLHNNTLEDIGYKKYLENIANYKKLIEENNNIDIDYIKYQLDEIEKIDVKENEIEEIELELSRISKFDKISNNVNIITNLFDKQEGICDLLYNAKRNINYINDCIK